MTQASRSPNSVALRRWPASAGPLSLSLSVPEGALAELIASSLDLYNVAWDAAGRRKISLDTAVVPVAIADRAHGGYLVCAQMLVDPAPGGLRATTSSGGLLVGRLEHDGERWQMVVPSDVVEQGRWPEVEDMLSLVLTTGWRRAGWVPLHGAGLSDGRRGMIVCAGSGGGKTTFTLALARRGWQSLGDDKLLLRSDDDRVTAAAITQMLNVDPAVAAWFPELAHVASLEQYSAWTVKRRVSMAALWPAVPAATMLPSTLVLLERRPGGGGIQVKPATSAEVISGLLRQTVIPRDRALARSIVATLSRCAGQVTGYKVTVTEDAYADPRHVDRLAEVLS